MRTLWGVLVLSVAGFIALANVGWKTPAPSQSSRPVETESTSPKTVDQRSSASKPQDRALPDRSTSPGANPLVIEMSVEATTANPPAIRGATNLPEGTKLSVHLIGDPPACVPRCGIDYGLTTVHNGSFAATLEDSRPLFSGSYTIDVFSGGAHAQPENVQAVIGKNGEHLRGPYVVTLERDGKYLPVTFPRDAAPSEGEQLFGLMIRYTQKILVAGNATADDTLRVQAIRQVREAGAANCNSIFHTKGQASIDACIRDSEARLEAALRSGAQTKTGDRGAQPPRSGVPASLPVSQRWKRVEADNGQVFIIDLQSVLPGLAKAHFYKLNADEDEIMELLRIGDKGKVTAAEADEANAKFMAGTTWMTAEFDCAGNYLLYVFPSSTPISEYAAPRSVMRGISDAVCIEAKNKSAAAQSTPSQAAPPPQSADAARPLVSPEAPTSNGRQNRAAPSFDCEKASTAAERLICSDGQLAEMDVRMADLYGRVLPRVMDQNEMRGQQRDWLIRRNACANTRCLTAAYTSRIADLQRWVGPQRR